MRELTILGTYNIRDLGGYATSDKRILKYGTLVRSGNLDKLTKTSQQQLIDYGIHTIIDVRDEWEAKHYPNPFKNSEAVSYHNLPLIGDACSNDEQFRAETSDYSDLDELYIKYIERCQPQIKQIISTIADSEVGILIHCHAGKDRTGIMVALILSAIGISDKDVAKDYALSNQNIQHLIAEWRTYEESKGHDMEQFEINNASIPKTMLNMLKYVEESYVSVNDYLLFCGLRVEQLTQLQSMFLI